MLVKSLQKRVEHKAAWKLGDAEGGLDRRISGMMGNGPAVYLKLNGSKAYWQFQEL